VVQKRANEDKALELAVLVDISTPKLGQILDLLSIMGPLCCQYRLKSLAGLAIMATNQENLFTDY
jgi:hypothetical protein